MVCSTLRPILEALKIEHFAIQHQEDLEFVADRMIKQAFATQAAATIILSPLLTNRAGTPA
jgi:hypothetical protein